MYCVMRASVPSLYNVYRRYDTQVNTHPSMPTFPHTLTDTLHCIVYLKNKAKLIHSTVSHSRVLGSDSHSRWITASDLRRSWSSWYACTSGESVRERCGVH